MQQRLAEGSSVESCYVPIIQSGGDYNLKLSAERYVSEASMFEFLSKNLGKFKKHCFISLSFL